MSFLASFYSTCCSRHFSRRALAAFTLTADTRLNCESRGKPSGSTPAAKRMKTTGPMDRPDQLAATNESQSNETPSNESNSNDTLRLLNGPPTITLTPTEAQICTLLQDVVSSIYQAQPSNPPLVLRIAGGWVRDKLLGLPSHDIDIAVDHMSGYDLAQHVAQHLETSGQAPRSVAKIASNPERSKHLETATTVILGQAVDFVNLRSETYNADSRIPHITYGTPLEDAMRRDITINALFYNISDNQVEDWTQRGLDDLRSGVVRTPMEPQRTFEDDPLRVLRVVRFASRFGYTVDEPTAQALGCEEVRRALDAKISRERVGAEVALMASGPRPLMAVRLLIAHALYPVVFRSPAALDSSSVLPVHVAEQLTHEVLAMLDTPELVDRLPMHIFSADSTETRRLLVLAAYLHPYHASLVTDGKRQVPAALVVMRDALKMSNHDTDTVVALHALASHVASTAASLLDSPTEVSRSHLGLEIRRAARLWPLAVVYAAALDSMNTSDAAAGKDKVVAKYVAYAEHVESRGLVQAYEVKHLVDGKRAASILGVRPGPVIKRVLEQVMVWQLDHPEGSREQCEAFVRDAGLPSDTA